MSDKSGEVREWWIELKNLAAWPINEKPALHREAILVIEKSAYDALKAENERLKETLKHDTDKIEAAYINDREHLRQLLSEARGALEQWTCHCQLGRHTPNCEMVLRGSILTKLNKALGE